MAKSVHAGSVHDKLDDAQLGLLIEGALNRAGKNPSKYQLAVKFRDEVRGHLGAVQVPDNAVR